MCYDINVPISDRNTYLDYDLLIYATASSGGNTFYANAIACSHRSTSPYRPIIGRIRYNVDQVGNHV